MDQGEGYSSLVIRALENIWTGVFRWEEKDWVMVYVGEGQPSSKSLPPLFLFFLQYLFFFVTLPYHSPSPFLFSGFIYLSNNFI